MTMNLQYYAQTTSQIIAVKTVPALPPVTKLITVADN